MPRKTRLRDRARLVCKICHARKVKCDLETSGNGICRNCFRNDEVCEPREGVRKRKRQKLMIPSPNHLSQTSPPNGTDLRDEFDNAGQHCPASLPNPESCVPTPPATIATGDRPGYVGDQSVLDCAPNQRQEIIALEGNRRQSMDEVSQRMLDASEALSFPRPVVFHAMADLYHAHTFHRLPICDTADTSDCKSLLLSHALCLVGTLLRQPQSIPTEALAFPFYQKAKALLNMNYEKENLTTLKAVCLLTCWSMRPPSIVSMDSPWHWNGVSLRLAIQMGLHRRSTYDGRGDTSVTRRIWWTIYSTGVLQSACFGRPLGIRSDDFDVQFPEMTDFDNYDNRAIFFIQLCRLSVIMATILEANQKRRQQSNFDATYIMDALKDWIRQVPSEFQCHNSIQRQSYDRLASELIIVYCVNAILFFRMCGNSVYRTIAQKGSLIAARKIAQLYEEMIHRDDINFLLPINNYFAMTAGVILIEFSGSLLTERETLGEDLQVIRETLKKMSLKWPAAEAVLTRLNYLERSHTPDFATRQPNGIVSGEYDDGSSTRDPASNDLSTLFPFDNIFHAGGVSARTVASSLNAGLFVGQLSADENPMQWILNEDDGSFLDLSIFELAFTDLHENANMDGLDPYGAV